MIRCPKCKKKKTKVYSVKYTKDGSVKRYRICETCGNRFKSLEVWEPDPEVDK